MDQRCRLCLNIYSMDLVSQFNSSLSDSSSVYEFYKILTSVDLEIQEDRDRSWICQKCLTKLSLFYDFRCLLIDNNKTFIKYGFDGKKVKYLKYLSSQIFIKMFLDPISTECSDIKDEYYDSNSPAPYEESCLAFDELELCDKIKAEPIEISVVQIAQDKTDESNRKWTRKTSPDDVDWEPRSQRVLRPKPVEAIKTKPLKSKNLKPKDSLISKYLAKYGKLLDEEDNLPLTKRQ